MLPIRFGTKGNVWIASTGVTAPLDHIQPFGPGWFKVGALTNDGVTVTFGKTMAEESIWQSMYVAARTITARTAQATFSFQESMDQKNFKFAMGGGDFTYVAASGTGATAVAAHTLYTPPPAEYIDERQICVENYPMQSVTTRVFMPRGMISGDIAMTFKRDESTKLPITFDVMGDDGVDPFYIRSNDPEWLALQAA